MTGDSFAVEVAKAALFEAGYADLAAMVEPNKGGLPMIRDDEAHRLHRGVITRAFLLAHQAIGHPAVPSRTVDANFEWVDCFRCPSCEERMEEAYRAG